MLRVTVANARLTRRAIAGRYVVSRHGLEFRPMFPLDPGRAYVAVFDPARCRRRERTAGAGHRVVACPLRRRPRRPSCACCRRPTRSPRTCCGSIWSSRRRWHARTAAIFLALDDRGREVKDAFLALDVDFWSPDGRRYTVFLDPGRVKRGILPNDQFGRALVAGRRYTIAIDPTWRDANGQPLEAAFTHRSRRVRPT